MQYTKLMRKDLRTFDDEAWSIISDAQDEGWLGALSSKGHVIMRAPDGQTTMSVSRDSLRGRSGRNARAEFDRWLREQNPTLAQGAKAITSNLFDAPRRELLRKTIRETVETSAAADGVPDAMLTILRNAVEDDQVADAWMRIMTDGRGERVPGWVMTDTRAANGQVTHASRAWHLRWVVFDPLDGSIISHGGPGMTDDEAKLAVGDAMADPEMGWIHTPAPTVAEPEPEPERERGECPICHLSFEDVPLHLERTHPTHEQCPLCGRWCKKGLGLRSHLRTHDEAATCEQCGRQVRPGPGLAAHQRMHQREQQADMAGSGGGRAAPVADALTPATVGDAPKGGSGDAVTAAEPQGGGPVEAILAILAELDDLRAADVPALRKRIEELTVERDAAITRADTAETTLTMLREALSMGHPDSDPGMAGMAG